MQLDELICKDLGIDQSIIEEAVANARTLVKIFEIPKKNGDARKIYHPSKKLKMIQYWLIRNVFEKMDVSESSMAYKEGVSILDNATYHSRNKYFLRLDFKDFFPSIKFDDLQPYLKAWHEKNNPSWDYNKESLRLIRESCFYLEDKLAIGYPSSPIISNIVMFNFDLEVNARLRSDFSECPLYTRYADDLVFSTSVTGRCAEVEEMIKDLVMKFSSPELKINFDKTHYGSSLGGSARVTGLKVCENGHITISKKQKDHIRLLLSLNSKGRLSEDEQRSLLGHLSYCRHVAPQFYSKVSAKFFLDIRSLKENHQY
ncbi:MAG: retron St85 family RNA-directed DNA polymerase [Saccharospirillum sp.]|uniref:retron St85 family RNA-directed DNA polymerase n=1 Tax=Saccharospirillum sp. TaxID=2033801 RepID=UPI0032993395